MFYKLKELCTLKKEKQMTTTNPTINRGTKEITNLKKQLKGQSEAVATLLSRMSILSDELAVLKGELGTFKKNVANDVKYLTDRVDS